MVRKIFYLLYFLMWTLALLLASLLFTQEYYNVGLMLGGIWGLFTLGITLIVLIILAGIYIFNKRNRITTRKSLFICLSPLFPAALMAIIYFYPKSLEEKEQTIELTYIRWACDCANWANIEDINRYGYSSDTIAQLCIYIEPANKSLELPEGIEEKGHIRFTGKFYEGKGFPKGYQSIEQPEKARVFRYTKFEVIAPQ